MVKAPLLPGTTALITNPHDIRLFIEGLVSRMGVGPVEGIAITPIASPGSYVAAKISVEYSSGSSQQIFFKDLTQPFRVKDNLIGRRQREMHVYEDLLVGADLGTPRLIDAHRDPSTGRCWLLLEYVEGTVIEDPCDELAVEAAAWLARMQAWFLSQVDRLDGDKFLVRHDAPFFLAPTEEAGRQVALLSPSLSEQFDSMLDYYGKVVELLSAQPRTLVHGGFIPWHVIVDASSSCCRVVAIDWELAAVGSPLYDLAFFTDWANDEVKERLYRAYCTSAQAHGVPTPDDARSMDQIMNGFRLYRTLEWLSKSLEREYSPAKVEQLVHRADALMASIGHLGSA